MIKKAFAVVALATLALFAVPTAASAAEYVPKESITVSGNSAASATVTINFDKAFKPRATVTFGVTGAGKPTTLSVVKTEATASLVKTAEASGTVALDVTLPAGASGSYTVTGTDGTTIGAATITVAAADAGTAVGTDDGLAETGYNAPVLLIWGAAGALLLGVALVLVLSVVRRQKATA
jgi:hypothetical protein